MHACIELFEKISRGLKYVLTTRFALQIFNVFSNKFRICIVKMKVIVQTP